MQGIQHTNPPLKLGRVPEPSPAVEVDDALIEIELRAINYRRSHDLGEGERRRVPMVRDG